MLFCPVLSALDRAHGHEDGQPGGALLGDLEYITGVDAGDDLLHLMLLFCSDENLREVVDDVITDTQGVHHDDARASRRATMRQACSARERAIPAPSHLFNS